MNRIFSVSLLITVALAACGDGGSEPPGSAVDSAPAPEFDREPPMKIDPRLEPFVERATGDLADRLEIAESEIEIAQAQFVTWPDGAVGCPEPGMMYTQALVPGYRIRLVANGVSHHYHGARDRPPFHCPAGRVEAPAPDSAISDDVR